MVQQSQPAHVRCDQYEVVMQDLEVEAGAQPHPSGKEPTQCVRTQERGSHNGAAPKACISGHDAAAHASLNEACHEADRSNLVWLEGRAVLAEHAHDSLQREPLKRALELCWLL